MATSAKLGLGWGLGLELGHEHELEITAEYLNVYLALFSLLTKALGQFPGWPRVRVSLTKGTSPRLGLGSGLEPI